MDDTIARFNRACGADTPLGLVVERADGVVVARGNLDQPFALIGRDPDCDLALLHPTVEPRHIVLQVVGGRVFAADLTNRPDRRSPGWLDPGPALRVGPFRVALTNPVSDHPAGFDPLLTPIDQIPGLPRVAVEFRIGSGVPAVWPANRAVTFVGRGNGCKVRLGGDDVAEFHACLVLTPDGLWLVDLLAPGGVLLNGEPVRCGRLGPGDEARIGRFVLTGVYPTALQPAAAPGGFEAAVGPVLRQLGDMQGQMFTQFQQSLVMMMRMFGEMHQEQMAAVQTELTRMAELNTELHKLQSELAKTPPPALPAARATVHPLPAPKDTPAVSASSADLHNHVWERMAKLDAERQTIWQRLFKSA